MASIAMFAEMQSALMNKADEDAGCFQAWFNWESTLEARRAEVRKRAQRSAQSIEHGASAFQSSMERAAFMIEHNNDPIRLGIEVVNGRLQQVRVLA